MVRVVPAGMAPEDVGVNEVDEPVMQETVLLDVLRQKFKPPVAELDA
jgi:hypothetical protein